MIATVMDRELLHLTFLVSGSLDGYSSLAWVGRSEPSIKELRTLA